MIKLAKKRVSGWAVFFAIAFMTGQVFTSLYLPNLTSDLVNYGVAKGDTNYIWSAGLKMLAVSVLSVIFSFGNVYLAAKTSQGLGQRLRQDIYEKVLYMSNDEFDQVGTSSLITRTTNDVVQIQNVAMMALRMMIMAPIMLVGASFMAYQKDAQLTSIFVVVIPIMVVFVGVVMYFAVPLFKAMQTKTDNLNLVFREGLTGVRVIRAFVRDAFEQNRFDEANKDYTRNARKVFSIMAVMFPLMTLIMSGTNIAIIWNGGHLIANQAMAVGNMIAFMTYAMQILMSFMMLSMVFVFIPRGQASAARIHEVLNLKSTLTPAEQPKTFADEPETSLDFDQVVFRYHGAEHLALTGVDAHVTKGQTLAIIGGTGSGKSTLINLIPRFYDVETGAVRINGLDVRDVDQQQLQSEIALVPQKAVLFKGSLRDNLRYGNPEATDEELWHALEIAQSTDFVKEAEGLDTFVEQGGNNFSGGQKQRLAIARALVKKASVYVFDDSFSALDFKTDSNLRRALREDESIQKAVVVIVGQRVSTVADADQIIVLDEGKMVGIGTHSELKANNETYREIVESQIKQGGEMHE
ncbi:ABC transporter transmembrane region family protein [Lapidilactobacillus concavus DSM 17758]|uniref:ABC transporter transmembrane region family protein n=1 Tax=Lapidilactobacillus concavus DSM 17758 TaxID=1423735 RepID=A0A0R1W550_9LACO|nr:ABC transporter ATP-binding protein [Lapidilactobacillus concavus]KRM12928.1 ABC transporter transmembrane region family protein [Lapidilactobacillus concavus DSM 17758]GEL13183.1 multidrug ABC transporter ATP-binding protein [Lapidilactobacillus concavus]